MPDITEFGKTPVYQEAANELGPMYGLCRRAARHASQLEKTGQRQAARKVWQDLAICQSAENNACPRQNACQKFLSRQRVVPIDNSLTFFDWDRMERRSDASLSLNGHVLKTGFEEVLSARDQWGNSVWHQRMSNDIVFRYEDVRMRNLLAMWQAKPLPELADFDFATLENTGILQWLHVSEHTSDGRTRLTHYAPNMVPIAGRDYTGVCVQDHELGIFAELQDRLVNTLSSESAPYYAISARRRRLSIGKPEAIMRRLELPYYSKGEFSGSLVFLQPH